MDATSGRTSLLAPDDPELDVLRWPRSPDGRWRVRRDDAGRLSAESVARGEAGAVWRLNVGGCSARVDWLEPADR